MTLQPAKFAQQITVVKFYVSNVLKKMLIKKFATIGDLLLLLF